MTVRQVELDNGGWPEQWESEADYYYCDRCGLKRTTSRPKKRTMICGECRSDTFFRQSVLAQDELSERRKRKITLHGNPRPEYAA